MDGTPGQPTSLGTRRHGIPGTVLPTRQSIGARILGTTVVGTHRGTTTLGIMDIPGDGAVRGITADGTTHGTGTLGTIADGTADGMEAGMEAGTAAGTIRGITEAGATAIITTTTVTSSVLAADGFTLHVLAQPAQAEEAESGPLQGAPE